MKFLRLMPSLVCVAILSACASTGQVASTPKAAPTMAAAMAEVDAAVAARGIKVVLSTHDLGEARRLAGEIVLFDKGYYVLAHFWELTQRGVFFVTRAKDNLACRVKKRLPRGADPRVLKDELIVLKGHYSRRDYPGVLRRVTEIGRAHV